MSGDVEICRQANSWRIGIVGEPLLHGAYRTLEEAIETAWSVAFRLNSAITVGKDRIGPAAA
jgi:hypothetical protein